MGSSKIEALHFNKEIKLANFFGNGNLAGSLITASTYYVLHL